jgi:hypothetical protein
MPREHGLWAWFGVPVAVAIALAPAAWPGALVAVAGFLVGNRLRARTRLPRHAALEIGGIAGFAAMGAALAVLGGAGVARAVAVQGAVAAWQVLGLWWVRGQLARVLPAREPLPGGVLVAVAAVGASLAAGVASGHALVGAVPLLYAVRIALARAPASPKDAARVGVAELGWTALAAGAAVLA